MLSLETPMKNFELTLKPRYTEDCGFCARGKSGLNP